MILINGGRRLCGELKVQGAKNSALPLLAAAFLCRGESVFKNCPNLTDVDTAVRILTHLGCRCKREGDTLTVESAPLGSEVPMELMRGMRSSIVFLGAVLSRCGRARMCFPGGCEIGPRPIDLHLSAMTRLGAKISEAGGCIYAEAPEGIKGASISLSFPSVGATENIILASACASGTTVIANAAREPEIIDLAAFLNRCGARIYGAGESCVIIDGVPELYGTEHRIMPDRIVAATYMAACAVTGGDVTLYDVDNTHLLPTVSAFEEAGCEIRQLGGALNIRAPRRLSAVKHIRTMPYPGFPTDAQPVLMSMAAVGRGTSVFVENIFENRYKHAEELVRLGASIRVEGRVAIVEGAERLSGAQVHACDLRGGAALVVAGLAADGTTALSGEEYIRRGYEDIVRDVRQLNADIREG